MDDDEAPPKPDNVVDFSARRARLNPPKEVKPPHEMTVFWESFKGDQFKAAEKAYQSWDKEDARLRREIGFSNPWKDLCKELIKIYRTDPLHTNGKGELGFTEVRDLIMMKEDKIEKFGSKFKKIRDPRLTRNDLQNWILYNKPIGTDKFLYIDCFIRKIQFTEWYKSTLKRLVEKVEERNRMLLSDIYQIKDNLLLWSIIGGFEFAKDRLFSTHGPNIPDDDAWKMQRLGHKRIVLYIKPTTSTIYNVIAIYYRDFSLGTLHPEKVPCTIRFGYLIPNEAVGEGLSQGYLTIYGDKSLGDLQPQPSGSSLIFDPSRFKLYLSAIPMVEEPNERITHTYWGKSKESWFVNRFGKGYSDHDTELSLINIDESPEIIEYLENLTNGFLIC